MKRQAVGWVGDICSCAGESVWLYCTCARASPQDEAADDHVIILWCHCHTAYIFWGGNIKGLTHETEESSSGLGFGRLGHRLFASTILVPPWGVGILNILGSVHSLFVIVVCIQDSPGCLDFVYLSCLCVSQVNCHPMLIKPGIREARTTALRSEVHIRGKVLPQWAHQIHPACPGHI